MKKLFFAFVLLVLTMLGNSSVVGAADNTQFKVEVYPLDCVFEYVNDGSNQIVYITPKECGQRIVTTGPEPISQFLQKPISVSLASDPEAPAAITELVPTVAEQGHEGAHAVAVVDTPNPGSAMLALTFVITGVSVAGVTLAVDFFAFELQFSKAALQWTRLRAGHVRSLIIRGPKSPL